MDALNVTLAFDLCNVTWPVTVATRFPGPPAGLVWVIVSVNVSLVVVLFVPTPVKVPRLTWFGVEHDGTAQETDPVKEIPPLLLLLPLELNFPDVVNVTDPADANADSSKTDAASSTLLFLFFTLCLLNAELLFVPEPTSSPTSL